MPQKCARRETASLLSTKIAFVLCLVLSAMAASVDPEDVLTSLSAPFGARLGESSGVRLPDDVRASERDFQTSGSFIVQPESYKTEAGNFPHSQGAPAQGAPVAPQQFEFEWRAGQSIADHDVTGEISMSKEEGESVEEYLERCKEFCAGVEDCAAFDDDYSVEPRTCMVKTVAGLEESTATPEHDVYVRGEPVEPQGAELGEVGEDGDTHSLPDFFNVADGYKVFVERRQGGKSRRIAPQPGGENPGFKVEVSADLKAGHVYALNMVYLSNCEMRVNAGNTDEPKVVFPAINIETTRIVYFTASAASDHVSIECHNDGDGVEIKAMKLHEASIDANGVGSIVAGAHKRNLMRTVSDKCKFVANNYCNQLVKAGSTAVYKGAGLRCLWYWAERSPQTAPAEHLNDVIETCESKYTNAFWLGLETSAQEEWWNSPDRHMPSADLAYTFQPFPNSSTPDIEKGVCVMMSWPVDSPEARMRCPSCTAGGKWKCPERLCEVEMCRKMTTKVFPAWPYGDKMAMEYYKKGGVSDTERLRQWYWEVECEMDKLTTCQILDAKACSFHHDRPECAERRLCTTRKRCKDTRGFQCKQSFSYSSNFKEASDCSHLTEDLLNDEYFQDTAKQLRGCRSHCQDL
jgi:hypothetical protein